MGLLPHSQLLDIHSAVMSAGLDDSRSALLAGIPIQLVASLPTAATPAAQILLDLSALNEVGVMQEGQFPFRIWLQNARLLSGARIEAVMFRRALHLIEDGYEARTNDPPTQSRRVALFVAYADADARLYEEFAAFLAPLRQRGIIDVWHVHAVLPGHDRMVEYRHRIDAADLVIVLVSSDFLALSHGYDLELQRLLQRKGKSRSTIIPVILRPCLFEQSWMAHLQPLPSSGKPITTWADRDDAWTEVMRTIERIISARVAERSGQPPLKNPDATLLPTTPQDAHLVTAAPETPDWLSRFLTFLAALFGLQTIANARSLNSKPSKSLYGLQEVFRKSGVPQITFVASDDFARLRLALIDVGRGVVVEGPSGVGKTTAIRTAVDLVGSEDRAYASRVQLLTARRRPDVARIKTLPEWHAGTVIIDDFHRLDHAIADLIIDHLKDLADSEAGDRKLVLIGIPRVGETLVQMSFDVATRIEVFRFGKVADDTVLQMMLLGEAALNIDFDRKPDILLASGGSLNIAQYICHQICVTQKVFGTQVMRRNVPCDVNAAIDHAYTELARKFMPPIHALAAYGGKRNRTTLRLLEELAKSADGSVSLKELQALSPERSSEIAALEDGSWVEKVSSQAKDFQHFFFFDVRAQRLVVDDPQLTFFLRRMSIDQLARDLGKSTAAGRSKVFVAYSHKDADWLIRLQTHMSPLAREGLIDLWDDSRIKPGMRWRDEIQSAMDAATVAIVLVSADLLASSFIQDYELPKFLRRAGEDHVRIFPIVVRPCDFAHTELAEFQSLNDPKKPLSSLKASAREAVLARAVETIRDSMRGATDQDPEPAQHGNAPDGAARRG